MQVLDLTNTIQLCTIPLFSTKAAEGIVTLAPVFPRALVRKYNRTSRDTTLFKIIYTVYQRGSSCHL